MSSEYIGQEKKNKIHHFLKQQKLELTKILRLITVWEMHLAHNPRSYKVWC